MTINPAGARSDLRLIGAIGVVCGLLAGFAGTATAGSSATIDGFSVTFNALPSADITPGLTPDSLVLGGSSYPVAPLVYPGGAGFSEQTTNPWGATNPFQYSSTLNGSLYDAIWNGAAIYNYNSPQGAVTILWGTIDASNGLEFFGPNGPSLGTISGADLAAAAATDDPGYVWANGVGITVQLSMPFYSLNTIGGPDLTMEYANLVATSVPEPTSSVLLVAGLISLASAWNWRR